MNFKVHEVKLAYKPSLKNIDAIKVTSSEIANTYLRAIWSDDIEHVENMFMLVLNRSNRIVGYYHVSKGGISGTVVDIRIIMQTAILMNASSIVLAHNHPSGVLTPSPQDKTFTEKIATAALLFDMKVLDHIIITNEEYYSFADEGLL